MSARDKPGWLDYAAVGVVSAATLAFEVLLLRVFGYSQWHHFAALAVSLALLGFGAAGTALALLGKRAIRHYNGLFMGGLIAGLSGMLLTGLLPHWIRLRPLFAVWDLAELAKLLVLDFVALVPFCGMALCIGLVFVRWPESTRRLYGANLLGSGAGALLASLLAATVFLETALLLLPALLAVLAALFAAVRLRSRSGAAAAAAAAGLLAVWTGTGPPQLPLSDFKRLAYLLDLPDSRVLERRPSLQTEARVVRSDSIRIAPGLSLLWPEPVPPVDALVLGSETVLPLPRAGGMTTAQPHQSAQLGQLPLLLRPDGPLAVIGTSEWLAPGQFSGRAAVWIERHAGVVRLYRERGLPDSVRPVAVDPRGFLSSGYPKYSLVYFAQCFAEGDAAGEDYLLTRESLAAALAKLDAGGLLAIPLRVSYPPRHAPKLFALLADVLRAAGHREPGRHVAFLRSMQEGLLLAGREPLGEDDIRAIRAFAAQWQFDIAALPGLQVYEANRYNILPEPAFFQSAQAWLAGEGHPPNSPGWFSTRVPADTRPYFWQTMRWRNLPDFLRTFGRPGLIWLDWAPVILAAALVVAGILATLLILLPLGRLPRARPPLTRPRILAYFGALGTGFMLLEMAAFQRAMLFLVDPVVTASVVFAVFLTGAGLGSLTAPQGKDRMGPPLIFASILLTAGLAFALLHLGQQTLSGLPGWMRAGALAAILAPLAWSLGAAFPWGLRQLDEDRALIPWAWGINGFASVIAAPAATLLSLAAGQPVSWLAGAACYIAAWLVARAWSRQWDWY